MKILHIIPSYIPAHFASGPITPTHYLNSELVKSGGDVTVYTTDLDVKKRIDVPLEVETIVDGVKVHYFKATTPISWFYSSSMKNAIRNNIKKFDVVHITSVFLSASTIGAYYARKFDIPYIISPHGSFMERPLKSYFFKKWLYIKLFEKKNLANASVIHFVAETEKDDYLKTKLPFRKFIIIPNGLNNKEFCISGVGKEDLRNKYKIPKENKLILFLGRIHPIKGLDTLIPALALVAKETRNFTLILSGYDEGGYVNEIMKSINACHISNKVIFTGPISGKDKISTLLGSDIFVLPSYSEACSMSLIEAMYFSLPSVLTTGVGFSEQINNYGAGIRVKKNSEEIAGAISKLLSNESLRIEMGTKARRLVEKEFLTERVVQRFVKEYNSLVNKQGIRARKDWWILRGSKHKTSE